MVLRLAVIGLGGLGRVQSQVSRNLEGVELVAGADIAAEGRNRFESEFGCPAYEDYRMMIEDHDLDAVTVMTPHTLHFEQTRACLEAGLHVHLEKPMVTTTADALELIEAAHDRRLVLQIGYQRHFHPAYREIKRLVEDGRLGDVHMAACYLAQDWIDVQAGTWRTDPELSGGGQLIDSGSHLLDVLLWATDAEPRTVAAVIDQWDQTVDVNSALSVLLDGPDGQVTASIGVSGDGDVFEEHLSIWGTEGRLAYEDGRLRVTEDGREYVTEVEEPTYVELTEEKLGAFAEAVAEGTESPIPGEFGLQVTRLTEAAFLASETGESVDAATLPHRDVDVEVEVEVETPETDR